MGSKSRIDSISSPKSSSRIGSECAGREDVDEPAADRHVPRLLHDAGGAVTETGEAFAELVGVDCFAGLQLQTRFPERLRSHHLVAQTVDRRDEEAVLARFERVQSGLDRGLDVTRGRLAIEGEDLELGQVVDLAHLPAVEVVAEGLGVGELRADHEPAAGALAVEAGEDVRRRRAEQSGDSQVVRGLAEQPVYRRNSVEPGCEVGIDRRTRPGLRFHSGTV